MSYTVFILKSAGAVADAQLQVTVVELENFHILDGTKQNLLPQ